MKKNYQKLAWLTAMLLITSSVLAQTKEISLRDALLIASKGNRQLQIRQLENKKAAEAVKEAKSFLLPTVAANSGYTIFTERPVIFLRNENSSPKLNDMKTGGRFSFDGNILANYPLLNPGIHSNIRLAGISEQIHREETKNAEEQLALNISQLYLTVLMNQEQAIVLQQSLLRNEKALKDSRSLFLQGKNLKTDTLSNYISVQNLKASLLALKNNVHVLSVQLKQLMGMEDSVALVFTDSLSIDRTNAKLEPHVTNVNTALDNRKDLKIRSLLIDQGMEQLQKEKSNYKPQLWAVAQYQVQSQADNLKIWNTGLPRTSLVGVKLSVPIFSGNRLKYRTAQSQFSIRQHELAMNDLKATIQTELTTLKANSEDARNQWEIQQQNVQAAQINYTMMNDRYRYGLGSRLELTDAELALTKAKLDHLQATFSIRLIDLQVKRAMGILQLN